jgi:hypothetical protein
MPMRAIMVMLMLATSIASGLIAYRPGSLPAGTPAPGAADNTSIGSLSVRPIDALVTGRRKPPPSVDASTFGAGAAPRQGSQGTRGQGVRGQGGPNAGGAL